jgi:hypothetical protein
MKEVKSLSYENGSLKTENAGLKNQLKYAEDVFHIVLTENSRRVTSMGNIAARFFQTPVDEFEEKCDLIEYLEE